MPRFLTQIGIEMKTYQELSDNLNERNYRKEYDNYHSDPKQIARRSARNSARRIILKTASKKDANGKDVHHKDNNPMNKDKTNLSIVTKTYNRKEPRMREEKTIEE